MEASWTFEHETEHLRRSESSGLHVLVVDNDADTVAILAILLRMEGHSMECATDGWAALEAASDRPPDVVLFDIGMPGMSDFVQAERLAAEASGKKPLLIAVTGYGQEQDKRHAEDAGIDLYLKKPVDSEQLHGLLRSFQAVVR